MRKLLAILLAPIALAGCATVPAHSASNPAPDGIVRAGLNQMVNVGGPNLAVLAVLEDSRCPMNARCIWAGQVRLRLRVQLGSGTDVMEITLGKPLPIADGMLELVEVQPDQVAGAQPKPKPYRFGFRFNGGL